MKHFNEQDYLKKDQYKNSKKYAARMALHRDYGSTDQTIWDWFFEIVLKETPDSAHVLEVGTGRGDMWQENTQRIPDGWDITLTDFSAGMIEDNKVHLGKLAQRMTYNMLDVQDIPYPDNSFDIVFANYMLYHVPDRSKAISELGRVLKAEGVLFTMTVGENHMKELYAIARQVDESNKWDTFFKDTFIIQNGAEQLHQQFADVRVEMFDNNLWITSVQPIIDWLRSVVSIGGEKVVAEQEAEIRGDLEKRIAADGGILIKREMGTFIARGANHEGTPSGD